MPLRQLADATAEQARPAPYFRVADLSMAGDRIATGSAPAGGSSARQNLHAAEVSIAAGQSTVNWKAPSAPGKNIRARRA